MITVKETAGDTLVGAIDGANTVFLTTFDFDGLVNVFLNGMLKQASLDDGYTATAPRTVTMKEAPLVGDTLEIEYKADVKTGGGALGGCPEAVRVNELVPTMLGTTEDC